jgi:endonuclease/exonuclease/phosphatase family metal-dependent hydrolase
MTQIRIATINLCDENPIKKSTLVTEWITVLSKCNIDILFIQEIYKYNIEKIASELGLKLLNINNFEGTCVFINPSKLVIIDNTHIKIKSVRKPTPSTVVSGVPSLQIYIGGIHLDDVPSLPHHMNNMLYKSSETIPLSYSMSQILDLCAKRRLPRIKEELKNIKQNDRAIIAGDFNEPSHLDLENIKTPVSIELEKNGFVDTYRHINKDSLGHTWPAGKFYKKQPKQRIDFIYTKNLKVVGSDIYDNDNDSTWLSDHKMVISDIHL